MMMTVLINQQLILSGIGLLGTFKFEQSSK